MVRRRVSVSALVLAASCSGACLDRPVVPIEPDTTRITTDKVSVARVEKLDLLIVVDNSRSMKDKQSELGRRIPELVAGLATPHVDPETGRVTRVLDMHVGVITSSLGAHGGGACHPARWPGRLDDRAHLLPRPGEGGGDGFVVGPAGEPVAHACPAPTPGAPLTWVHDPSRGEARFVGESGALELQAAASCAVQSAQDDGCGYEATWEALYRFLVDPAPPVSDSAVCAYPKDGPDVCTSGIEKKGVDHELLAQRKAFLRDDSLLAVIVLSDENDFSLRALGDNFLPWSLPGGAMPKGNAACAGVPDDFEPDDPRELDEKYGCRSCLFDPKAPGCDASWAALYTPNADSDATNLRGFQQARRFGHNFLWSRRRYVDAFTAETLLGDDGKPFPNPLLAKRSRDLIVVSGIVGAPPSLVADETGRPRKLGDADWERLVSADTTKRDAHMIESIAPRPGLAKFAGDRAVDPVHGGDRDVLLGEDLQYACIGKRSTETGGDDCNAPGAATNDPLCGAEGAQPYFKAYPGLRHLRILRDLGPSSVVASICSESYGPAIAGVVDRIRNAIDGQCLRSRLQADAAGEVPCVIVESFAGPTHEGKGTCEEIGDGYCTPGAFPCRIEGTSLPPVPAKHAAAQLTLSISVAHPDGRRVEKTQAIEENGNVYVVGSDDVKHLVCETKQLAGGRVPDADAKACVSDPKWTPKEGGGWCYTTDPTAMGSRCVDAGGSGKIRFFGATEPKNGSEVFTMCSTR